MNCTFEFEGHNLSEEELIDRIRKELDTNEDLQKLAAVVYKLPNPHDTLQDVKREGDEAKKQQQKKKIYVGVNDFVTAQHENLLGGTRLTAEYEQDNREDYYIEQHKKDFKGTEEQQKEFARQSFKEQIEEEEKNLNVGLYVHGLVNVLLEKGRGTAYDEAVAKIKSELAENNYDKAKSFTANDSVLSKEKDMATLVNKIVDKIENESKELHSWVISEVGQNCEIYSELPMLLKKQYRCNIKDTNYKTFEGIYGVADLVLLNKDTGDITIVDYKVCSRPYEEWYQAKLNEVDYQLAMYRAILTNKGFDGRNIRLLIKPVLFRKQNISSLKVQPTVNAISSTTGGARLGWGAGRFTKRLRELGLGNEIIPKLSKDPGLASAIEEDRKVLIGTYDSPRSKSKEWYIKNDKIIEDKDSKGNVIGYKFYSPLEGESGGWKKAKTKEAFTKDGGIIDLFIDEINETNSSIASTLVEEIDARREEKNGGKKSGISAYLKSQKNAYKKAKLEEIFGKYESQNWICISNQLSEELLDQGILVFSKADSQHPGHQILDIVVLANMPLGLNISISGNSTVLGMYVDDDKKQQLGFHALESQYKNIRAIEAVAALNTLIGRNPDSFTNMSLGRLAVINPGMAESWEQMGTNIEGLMENFDYLCNEKRANIKNNFKLITLPTTFEYCMQEVIETLSKLKEDPVINRLLSDIDDGEGTIKQRQEVVKRLIIEMRNHYRHLQDVGAGGEKLDLTRPEDQVFYLLQQMNMYLRGLRPEFDGRIPKIGFSVDELFALAGLPWTGKMKRTDSSGTNIVGLLNGADMDSPEAARAPMQRQLNEYLNIIYSNVSSEFMDQSSTVQKLTKDYALKFGTNMLMNSNNLDIWERLLVHVGDKVSPELLVKDPYDMTNDLTVTDREFLKQWLWEVNKYLIPGADKSLHYKGHEDKIDGDSKVKEWKASGKYFQLPLMKANGAQRWKYIREVGWKTHTDRIIEDLRKDFDPRELHTEMRRKIKRENKLEMPNNYIMNLAERESYISSVGTPYDFSFDLDYIALDVAYQSIRKEHYDEGLLLAESVLAVMNVVGESAGVNMDNEKEAIKNQVKLMKGESIMTEDQLNAAPIITGAKKLSSIALLALRPLQFLKELSFGMWSNFSRAWILKLGGGSNALSLESVSKASGIVWGLSMRKVSNAMFDGNSTLADFTTVSLLNRLYRIANQDMMHLAKNASMSRVGIGNNPSKWMYIAQSAPDYFNRMTLFIAKMLEDGCFEAHTLDENGNIHYDWKKDARFSELAKHGLNSDYTSPEYNKQKALYAKMCAEFERGGLELIKWDPKNKRYEYGDITQAYTPKQKSSIKEIADLAFGYYDQESKAQINSKFVGLVFLQFQTFLSAKFNLWLKAPANAGENTAQGLYVLFEQDGVKYFRRHKINSETGEYEGSEDVPETELSDEEKAKLEPVMVWQGDYTEGLIYSLIYTIRDLFTINWKLMLNNKLRMANVLLAMHDLLAGFLLFNILKFLFSKGTGKMQDVKPLSRVFLRGMQDVSPSALTLVSFTPAFVSTLTNIKTDGVKLLFDSDDAVDGVLKHIGATKDWMWNEQ